MASVKEPPIPELVGKQQVGPNPACSHFGECGNRHVMN
jgi:hypothetical protein